MPNIDDEQYRRGRAQFDYGGSLRAMVAALHVAGSDVDEDSEMSFALGFVDAAFDRLRGIAR